MRGLAGDLGVSPSTVANAYRDLQGVGFWIRLGPPGDQSAATATVSPRLPWPSRSQIRDLRSGGPDPPCCLRSRSAVRSRGYGEAASLPAWPRWPATRSRPTASTPARWPWSEVPSTGSNGCWRASLHPGDRVIVRTPGTRRPSTCWWRWGWRWSRWALDDRGIRPERLAAALDRGADAALLTPRAHEPDRHRMGRVTHRRVGGRVGPPSGPAGHRGRPCRPGLGSVGTHGRTGEGSVGHDPIGVQAVQPRPAARRPGRGLDDGEPGRRASGLGCRLGQLPAAGHGG